MARNIYRTLNLNHRFQHAARTVAEKVSRIDGVVGIAAAGGIGRGHSDQFSDLDMFVYADSDKVREIRTYIAVGQMSYRGISYDIPVESYQNALRRRVPSAYWNQIIRWTLENSRIMYDTDNRIKRMLAEKIVFPEPERRKMMKEYRHEADEMINYIYPTWRKRGQVYHLAGILRKAAEYLILWIYAYNRKFQPYLNKWLFYHLENGAVPEARYLRQFKRAFQWPVRTGAEADYLRSELFKVCAKIDIDIEPANVKKDLARQERNWAEASSRTRHYLSF